MSVITPEKPIASMTRSDSELQNLVLEELRWDIEVPEASVGVEVDEGTVTLTGTVGSFSEKMAALRAAHRVEGVLDVANDLEIVYQGHAVSDDTRIAQAARHALEDDSRIPHTGIQITVSQGFVTLEGKVLTWLARYRAEAAVEHLTGVRGIANHITVTPSPARDSDIRCVIEQALERQTARRAKQVQVGIVEGVVTLTGTVRSWPERDAAFESASHAPGVRSVVNRLKVNPYF